MQLKYKDYFNKVYGGWMGKCIGGAAGAKQENNKNLMNYSIANVFPEHIPPNDDFDLQVLWLKKVLQEKGSLLTSNDLAQAFAKYNLCLANEYSFAIKNIDLGIDPPISGLFNNDFFKNSMGCPIRSEIWGFICPGNPDIAVRYAKMDGMIDHDIESIIAEQYLSAIESEAFFENDIVSLVKKGLTFINRNTKFAKCIEFVLNEFLNEKNWIIARNRLVTGFGSSDASYVVVNIGITIMALLYGEGDFEKTLLIAVNSGYDTDCTAATACAILGVINGKDRISEFLLEKIGEEIDTGTIAIENRKHSIIDLVEETCAAGFSFMRDGITSINITGIPTELKGVLPLCEEKNPLELIIEYIGLPSIAYDEKSSVDVIIYNRTGEEQRGILNIKTPECLYSNIKKMEVIINPGSEMKIEIDFFVEKDVLFLPQKNIVNLCFEKGGVEMIEKTFGFSGATRMKLIGPFFDNYDTTKYEEDPFLDVRQIHNNGRYDLFSMFNGYVNIDKCYIDESFLHIDKIDGEYVNFHMDKLDIDNKIGYTGPCCIYLVYDFISPRDFDNASIVVGNNDAYKCWLNNEMILGNREVSMYMPYNNYSENIKLNKGLNRIVMKITRSSEKFEFSCLLKNNIHWFVDLASCISI